MTASAFHFAFFVNDLDSTRRFYSEILGCNEGRSRIREAGIQFVIEPMIRFAGEPGEQATMFVLDLSGNALELKSYRHPEHVFTA